MEHNYIPLWNGPKEDTLLWKTPAFPLWNGPKEDAFLEREREREEEREWVYGLSHHFLFKMRDKEYPEQRNEKKTVWMENYSCGK
jgi:hypothetical protein